MTSKDRESEAATVVKHPISSRDRARDHVGGSVKKERAKPHHYPAFMMLSPVKVINPRQIQFLRRASVASEMISVHQILRVITIAITIERRRAAMYAAPLRIAVVQLRQLS